MVMMSKGSRIAIATIAGLLALSASGAQARELQVTGPVRVDLTASAQPVSAGTRATDVAFHVDTVRWDKAHAATTATASAICRRCSGEAISLQVLYLDWSPSMKLDNVAVGWTQGCRSCSVTSVSLQVAVVTGRGSTIAANNRALALNASCRRCDATSAAYQLVVSGTWPARLSASTVRSLEEWASERARVLRATPASRQQRARVVQHHRLARVAHRVNAELGTGTVAAHVRLSAR
jgi:hypothetical protein